MGRTARAGAKGRSLTFIEDDDRTLLKEVGAWVLRGRAEWWCRVAESAQGGGGRRQLELEAAGLMQHHPTFEVFLLLYIPS